MNLAQTIIHRCFVKLELTLMFAETDDMRKQGLQSPDQVALSDICRTRTSLVRLRRLPGVAKCEAFTGSETFWKGRGAG